MIDQLTKQMEDAEYELCQHELPLLQQGIDYLETQEAKNVEAWYKALYAQISQESAGFGVTQILNGFEMARRQLGARKTQHEHRIAHINALRAERAKPVDIQVVKP